MKPLATAFGAAVIAFGLAGLGVKGLMLLWVCMPETRDRPPSVSSFRRMEPAACSPSGNRPSRERLFSSQPNFFAFMTDHEALALTQ